MRRRDLIGLLGGWAALRPLAARTQTGDQMRRIGVLMDLAESDQEAQSDIAALQAGLKDLGWSDGRNIAIDVLWSAGDSARMQALAAELVGLHPDLLIGHTTGPTIALRQETHTIPITFIQISDPIGSGLISSLARPGGNLTGSAAMSFRWEENGSSC